MIFEGPIIRSRIRALSKGYRFTSQPLRSAIAKVHGSVINPNYNRFPLVCSGVRIGLRVLIHCLCAQKAGTVRDRPRDCVRQAACMFGQLLFLVPLTLLPSTISSIIRLRLARCYVERGNSERRGTIRGPTCFDSVTTAHDVASVIRKLFNKQ